MLRSTYSGNSANGTFAHAADHLQRCDAFKKCSPEFINLLSHQIEPRFFQEGEEICRQGDIGDCLFILRLGKVDVEVKGADGPIKVAMLQDGAIFGEMAAISKSSLGAKRSATIRATTCCNCFSIGREALMRVLERFPSDEAVLAAEAQARRLELAQKGGHPPPKRRWSQVCTVVKFLGTMGGKLEHGDSPSKAYSEGCPSPASSGTESPVASHRAWALPSTPSAMDTVDERDEDSVDTPRSGPGRSRSGKLIVPQREGLQRASSDRSRNHAATTAANAMLAPKQPEQRQELPQQVPEHLRAAVEAAVAMVAFSGSPRAPGGPQGRRPSFRRNQDDASAWRIAIASDPACDKAFTDAWTFLRDRERLKH